MKIGGGGGSSGAPGAGGSKDFGDVLQIGWQEKVTVFFGIVVPEVESQIKTCLMI